MKKNKKLFIAAGVIIIAMATVKVTVFKTESTSAANSQLNSEVQSSDTIPEATQTTQVDTKQPTVDATRSTSLKAAKSSQAATSAVSTDTSDETTTSDEKTVEEMRAERQAARQTMGGQQGSPQQQSPIVTETPVQTTP